MLVLLLSTGPFRALAQDVTGGDIPRINAQLFRNNIDGSYTFQLDDTAIRKNTPTLRTLVHYTMDPLVYDLYDDQGALTERQEILSDVVQLDLSGGYTLGRWRLGVNVPLVLLAAGSEKTWSGLGELALDAKMRLLDHNAAPVGLALDGRLIVSSSTLATALGPKTGPSWEATAIIDKDFGDLLLAANLGVHLVPEVELENITWGDSLLLRVGGGYSFTPKTGVSLELSASQGLASLGTVEGLPIELLAGTWLRPWDDEWVLRAGAGTALSGGIGAAPFRAMLGVGREPREVRDRDADTVRDRFDDCPDTPEDGDGWLDTDGCPEPVQLTVKVVGPKGPIPGAKAVLAGKIVEAGVMVEREYGRYPSVVRAEGFETKELVIEVPDGAPVERVVELVPLARLSIQVVDAKGAPVAAQIVVRQGPDKNVHDGSGWDQALKAGEYGVEVMAPGFQPARKAVTLTPGQEVTLSVPMVPARAAIDAAKNRIEIRESVYFETGKATIKPESFPLLDDVAGILLEHPEIARVRVEGHTDSQGDAKANLKLSKERAASVRDYLVRKGVKPERLESEGYGEGRPVAKGENEAAWSQNRRVEFVIVGGGAPPK